MKNVYTLAICLLLYQTLTAQTLKHSELLCRPTSNSATIQIVFADSAEIKIEYGTISGTYTNSTTWQTFSANQFAQIDLTGLLANTQYYYRVTHRIPSTTTVTFRPERKFHTQRANGNTFSFVVQADPHVDNQSDTLLYKRCLKNQLNDNPDFMIDLGDFLMTDKLKNSSNQIPFDTIPYRCQLLRSYYDSICHSVPLFITLGNHEGESGWNLNGTANNIAVWNTNERKKYFPNPQPNSFYTGDTTNYNYVGKREAYYAWTWGDALFVVIDPYWNTNPKPDSLHGWRWTLGKPQYDWLKQSLENSNATFKFVFCHHLVGGDPDGRGGIEFADKYEWGGNNLDGTQGWATERPGWYKPIKEILKENRVTIFFHGHDHFFGKQEKDCLIYQECPQPSHPNFTTVNYATDYGYINGQILPNSGHIRVTVSATGITTQYIRAYLPANENATRHNGDTSATYFIGNINCYDSLQTGFPILWNAQYADELIYPNPFQKQTTIELNLGNTQKISLCIYNNLGIKVKTLLHNQLVQAGSYKIIWDGTGIANEHLPNGNYIYKITSEYGNSNSGQILLIK